MDFSVEDASTAWDAFSADILPPLKLNEPVLQTDPLTLKKVQDDTDRQLVVQHLEDLGYLPESPKTPDEMTLRRAFERWREDEKALGTDAYKYDKHHPAFSLITSEDDIGSPRLAALLGFEKEIQLLRLPHDGELSLLTRIVHYRLRSFGLYEGSVNDSFNENTRIAIEKAADLLKLEDDEHLLDSLNILGDCSRLSEQFMRHHGTWVFVFSLHPPEMESLSEFEGNDYISSKMDEFTALQNTRTLSYSRLFIGIRESSAAGGPGRSSRRRMEDEFTYYSKKDVPHLSHRRRKQIASRPPPQEASESLVNRFGLELLQLRLWLYGYYKGEIDGVWGPLSLRSAKDFLAANGIDRYSDFIKRVEDDYVAVNLRYVFKKLLPQYERDAKNIDSAKVHQLSTEVFNQANTKKRWSDLEESYKNVSEEEKFLDGGKKKRRRSFSIWGLFAAVGRFLKRAAKSIKKAVLSVWKALKKMVGTAIRIFQQGIRFIKKGLEIVSLATKRFYYWLLEKPIMSVDSENKQFAFTRFSHDGDTIAFSSARAKHEFLTDHHRKIRRMTLAFQLIAKIAIKAISLLRQFVTYNWLRLAWTLRQLLTDDFWEELSALYAEFKLTAA